jgi:glycerol-3-phosphate dehydrogenase
MTSQPSFDLAVIGGGINGVGIAADAAGRGLKVCLIEQNDLASGTSSASSKLIHGGLRYLEHYEFALVREGLAEREVLLRRAPHIVWPLRFVLPHVPSQRPAWMIRAGLFLYDHLYRRRLIPPSASIDLTRDPAGAPLAAHLTRGFAYWDCWVDDARLVVLTARSAADLGAQVWTRTQVVAFERTDAEWRVHVADDRGRRAITARALVNAAGPWVDRVRRLMLGESERDGRNDAAHARLVKGSHIVVPRIRGAGDAYLLQNADGRVVFALPYEERFTLIGTTDVPFSGDPASVAASADEERYLIELASRFFRAPLAVSDIVWRYAGVRSLYDDGSADPSAVTRDYHLALDASPGAPALLTVYGGKVTTHRRLAEDALAKLQSHLPPMGPAWTSKRPLPGGEISGRFDDFVADLARRHPGFDAQALRRLAHRYGSLAGKMLAGARGPGDLGADLGMGLSEREVLYLRDHEWARTADDVLWRRTKVGLHLTAAQREQAARRIDDVLRR